MTVKLAYKDTSRLIVEKKHYQNLLDCCQPKNTKVRNLIYRHINKLKSEIESRQPIRRMSVISLIGRKSYYSEQMRSLQASNNSIAIKLISIHISKLNYLIEKKLVDSVINQQK